MRQHRLESASTTGEVTEWLKVHAWNACVRKYREFESHPLRQIIFYSRHCFLLAETYILHLGQCSKCVSRAWCDSRVLRNRESRTPSGPGGSSGSESLCVLQGCPAILFCAFRSRIFWLYCPSGNTKIGFTGFEPGKQFSSFVVVGIVNPELSPPLVVSFARCDFPLTAQVTVVLSCSRQKIQTADL